MNLTERFAAAAGTEDAKETFWGHRVHLDVLIPLALCKIPPPPQPDYGLPSHGGWYVEDTPDARFLHEMSKYNTSCRGGFGRDEYIYKMGDHIVPPNLRLPPRQFKGARRPQCKSVFRHRRWQNAEVLQGCSLRLPMGADPDNLDYYKPENKVPFMHPEWYASTADWRIWVERELGELYDEELVRHLDMCRLHAKTWWREADATNIIEHFSVKPWYGGDFVSALEALLNAIEQRGYTAAVMFTALDFEE